MIGEKTLKGEKMEFSTGVASSFLPPSCQCQAIAVALKLPIVDRRQWRPLNLASPSPRRATAQTSAWTTPMRQKK
jgi:hypothetical protein